jgi:hypothetical protein
VSSTIIAVSVPTALNVHSTLDELVALARGEPGKLNLAPTPGTTEITFDNFMRAADITMTKIPYSDVTKALADLSENRVQVMVSGIAIVKSQVETGKVKLLAITNLKRAAAVPDLPTATEAGYPALALDGLIGLFGPKSLPPGTAERIAADVRPSPPTLPSVHGSPPPASSSTPAAPRSSQRQWKRSAKASPPPPRPWASSRCDRTRRPHGHTNGIDTPGFLPVFSPRRNLPSARRKPIFRATSRHDGGRPWTFKVSDISAFAPSRSRTGQASAPSFSACS